MNTSSWSKRYFSVFYTFAYHAPFALRHVSAPFKLAREAIEFPTVLRRLPNGSLSIWYGCADLESRGLLVSEAWVNAKLAGGLGPPR